MSHVVLPILIIHQGAPLIARLALVRVSLGRLKRNAGVCADNRVAFLVW
jgi:hypothetical protein